MFGRPNKLSCQQTLNSKGWPSGFAASIQMKARAYDDYIPLARITAPSYRFEGGRRSDEPIHVITAIDDRFYPQQWDTTVELFADVAGDNMVNDLPDGLDRRKDWGFAAYLKHRKDGLPPLLVGIDAMPNRVYRKSVLPTATKDLTELVINWRPSGLVEVTKRPPLVSFEVQSRIIKGLNDVYVGQKKLEAGTKIIVKGKELGTVVAVTDSEITVRPKTKASAGKPVYTGAEDDI